LSPLPGPSSFTSRAFRARAAVRAGLAGALLALVAGCTFSSRGLEIVPGGDIDGGDDDGGPADAPHDQPTGDGTIDKVGDRPPVDLVSPDRPPDEPTPTGTGIPCTPGGVPCATGFCVDGVCCESACSGLCQACAAGKTGSPNGLCRPLPAGMDPDVECPDDGMASCKRNGACDGQGACALYPSGTMCGAGSCIGSLLAGPSTCNGGACQPAQPMPCAGGFACATNQSCKTTCTGDGDCAPNIGCNPAAGSCSIMKKLQGQPCNADQECGTNTCADGVCCDRPCNGRCRACVKALTGVENGTCDDIMAGVKPTRPAECPIQKNTCGNNGLCDGDGNCQQIADGTQCGTYCCGQGSGNANFCHLICANGACGNQSGVVAGSCADTSPCTTRARCNDMGTTHVCQNEGSCNGLLPCCCVGPGVAPACTDIVGCTLGMGGTCMQ
jgi:hypothetical protein